MKIWLNSLIVLVLVALIALLIFALEIHYSKVEFARKISIEETYPENYFNACALQYASYRDIEDHQEEIRECISRNSEGSYPFSVWREGIGIFTSPEIEGLMSKNRIIFDDGNITIIDINNSKMVLVRKKVQRKFQDGEFCFTFEFLHKAN